MPLTNWSMFHGKKARRNHQHVHFNNIVEYIPRDIADIKPTRRAPMTSQRHASSSSRPALSTVPSSPIRGALHLHDHVEDRTSRPPSPYPRYVPTSPSSSTRSKTPSPRTRAHSLPHHTPALKSAVSQNFLHPHWQAPPPLAPSSHHHPNVPHRPPSHSRSRSYSPSRPVNPPAQPRPAPPAYPGYIAPSHTRPRSPSHALHAVPVQKASQPSYRPPATRSHSVPRRAGWFNSFGDQLWTNDGGYVIPPPGHEYPPDLAKYPKRGEGWMNEEGRIIDMHHRLIAPGPVRRNSSKR